MKFDRFDFSACAGYTGYSAATLALPVVLVPMAAQLGFSDSAAGGLHLLRSAVMVLVMLFSGVPARRFGKGMTLGFSLTAIATGMLICSCAPSYLAVLCGIVVLSMGSGLSETLVSSFMADRHPGPDSGKYISYAHSCWALGMILVATLGGFLLQHGVPWRAIPLVIGIYCIIPLSIYFTSGFQPNTAPKVSLRGEMGALLRIPSFWLFLFALFVLGGAEHCLFFWMPKFIETELHQQPLLSDMGVTAIALGLFVGRVLIGAVPNKKLLFALAACAVTALLLAVGIGFVTSVWLMLPILFLIGVVDGPLWPSLQFFCAEHLQRADSTPVYILLPLIGIPGCGFFTWLMGIASDHLGPQKSVWMIPGCYTALCLALTLIIIVIVNHRKRPTT